MRVFVLLASGILEDGSVAFFHLNLKLFSNRIVFSMTVVVFWLQTFWKTVLGPFFHMNLYAFLKQMCFFNESVCFFGFRHFGRRFCGIFSYEFISFFSNRIVLSRRVFGFLASGILQDGSVPLHMNL